MSATTDEEIIEAEFPGWHVWRSQGRDGQSGELMATRRRRDLTIRQLEAGLALTLPMGYGGDLRKQLADQVRREEIIGYVPGGDAP